MRRKETHLNLCLVLLHKKDLFSIKTTPAKYHSISKPRRKTMKTRTSIKIILFLIISSMSICILAYLLGTLYLPSRNDLQASSNVEKDSVTVIIDAGHGGEDGGASSVSGLVEKDVNLDISLNLFYMLSSCGVKVIMTRTDDRLLYDRNVDFQGRKKKLDLAARLTVANDTDNAIFISIHMNSYTNPKYSGLQVWYSQNEPSSYTLAELIQTNNRKYLQPYNNRKTKAATSAINLLHNATCPAVLVECGFLSNPDEAALFETEEYKQKVAFILFSSIMEYLNEKSSAS